MYHRVLPLAYFVALACSSQVSATPQFDTPWADKYPTSTLPARMQAQTGTSCNVCHHAGPGTQGNCYRDDLAVLLGQGLTIQDAIDQLDLVDSDGDGVPNGEEATTPRADDPAEVGYNPGLVGETGTDPCGSDPSIPVTGVWETPPQTPVPTMSQWGSAIMSLLLVTVGSLVMRSRRSSTLPQWES
ncbi:MAG: hypothetical protein ACE5HE_13545 [Phycisphaerae bacterium]